MQLGCVDWMGAVYTGLPDAAFLLENDADFLFRLGNLLAGEFVVAGTINRTRICGIRAVSGVSSTADGVLFSVCNSSKLAFDRDCSDRNCRGRSVAGSIFFRIFLVLPGTQSISKSIIDSDQ